MIFNNISFILYIFFYVGDKRKTLFQNLCKCKDFWNYVNNNKKTNANCIGLIQNSKISFQKCFIIKNIIYEYHNYEWVCLGLLFWPELDTVLLRV